MIKNITVLGSGIMGHAITGHFAMHGHPVVLYDAFAEALPKAMQAMRKELELFEEEGLIAAGSIDEILARVTPTEDLEQALKDADYVIEAAPERMELKQQLFADMERYGKSTAIFASNTSSLPLEGMTQNLKPETAARCMVCHWYNPAHIIPIAELSFFGNMPQALYDEVEELYQKSGKNTVKVLKDVPGLVANRIQQGVAREVFSLIEQGVAAPEDIDKALKFGPAFRYATTGQLEVADFGGLDIWCTVGDNLLAVMDNSKEANPALRAKVQEGKLGFKTGEGFFDYPQELKAQMQKEFNKRLIHQLKASEYYK